MVNNTAGNGKYVLTANHVITSANSNDAILPLVQIFIFTLEVV